MKIHVLGTRGEIESSAPYHSHHSGVIIDNDILLDLGEEEFLKHDYKSIFITHLHPDHAFFVRDSYSKQVQLNTQLYAPEKYNDYNIQIPIEKISYGPYSITPIPTHHSKKVKSNAYLITLDNTRILYSGDLIWINKKYHHLINKLDLVITEASFIRKEGRIQRDHETWQIYGHAGIPRLINLFKEFTDRILFVHFGEWFYKDISQARNKLKRLGRKNNIQVIVGYDGLKIDI